MTDEKYLFITDCADKKRTGRSAFNRRAHNGKGGSVKLPSDYLSGKELQAMNGDVVSYKLNEPMDWATFNAMPEDVQKMYILAIRKRFDVKDERMAGMFGCSLATWYRKVKHLGCQRGERRGGKPEGDLDGWNLWLAGQKVPEPEKPEEEPEAQEDAPPSPAPDQGAAELMPKWEQVNSIPVCGNLTFQGNAGDIMRTVTGILGENTYARITISWETEEDRIGCEGILPANQTY